MDRTLYGVCVCVCVCVCVLRSNSSYFIYLFAYMSKGVGGINTLEMLRRGMAIKRLRSTELGVTFQTRQHVPWCLSRDTDNNVYWIKHQAMFLSFNNVNMRIL